MLKITRQEYNEFLKGYLMDVIKVPSYRFGQAFLNMFPEIDNYLQGLGDQGISDSAAIWSFTDTAKVKSLIEIRYVST